MKVAKELLRSARAGQEDALGRVAFGAKALLVLVFKGLRLGDFIFYSQKSIKTFFRTVVLEITPPPKKKQSNICILS